MLKPDYFENKSDLIIQLYKQLEQWIMSDIAMRLLKSGEMSGTADRLIWKLRQMGESREAIFTKLQQITKLSKKELKALLQDAVLTSWKDDKFTYSQMGIDISSPLENAAVIRVMDAEYRKSMKTLDNLTRTTMEQSQRDLMNMLDKVEIRMASGAQSYSAAVCDILDNYAGNGFVIYPTIGKNGKKYKMTLEAAVNLIVRTSLNQTSAQVTNQYITEAKTNYVLISAHYGARTAQKGQPALADHSAWQGKAYSIRGSEPGFPNLLESTGYDIDENGNGIVENPLGLHGYNCRHSHQPWDKDLRNPWIDENGKPIIDNEKSKKIYEDNQKARAMERAIRKTKRELLMKEQEINGVAETDVKDILQQDYDRIAHKLRKQNKQYNDFCAENDIQKQHERIKVSKFNRKQAAKANGAATRYQNKKDNPVEKSSDRGIINDRNMANGMRKSPFTILDDKQIETISQYADELEIPRSALSFNTGLQTGFSDKKQIINVRGDIFPDTESSNNRDLLSERAVLAHEYYGHMKHHPSQFDIGDWRDEFRASYSASIDTPNLSDEERRMLMLDAFDRAKEDGVSVKYNKKARLIIYGYDTE